MTRKKNNSANKKKPRMPSGVEGFGIKEEVADDENKELETKKRGPKLIIREDAYRTVPKDKKLIFSVPNFGVELIIDDQIFTVREFHKLFPSKYREFNIFIDHAKREVSFHIPYMMSVEHKLFVRYRQQNTFVALKYAINPEK